MPSETEIAIPWAPGYVVIGSDVYSYIRQNGRGFTSTPRKIASRPDHLGYYRVDMTINGRRVHRKLHRIIAEAYHGPSDLEVNHKDGVKANNAPSNLEYVTSSENKIHAFRLGLRRVIVGDDLHNSKLSAEQVLEVRRQKESGRRVGEIAAEFRVSISTIYDAVSGRTWSHVRETQSQGAQ